jgi:hypothetical protein
LDTVKRNEYRCAVPEGRSGAWAVQRFTVTDEDVAIFNMRCAFSPGQGRRTISAGTYTRLSRGGTVIMSDTSAEIDDLWKPVSEARGNVLVNGLGLGVAVDLMLQKPEVSHITVVEKSTDVIALVGPHYTKKYGARLSIVNADAFEYQPKRGARFDAVWHDIWDDICADNLKEMATLHRRYGRRSNWQGSWCRYLCEIGR